MRSTLPTDRRDWGDPPSGSLQRALWCARFGWPVHPLAPGRKTPAANCEACRAPDHTHQACPCRDAGRACHGFYAATVDEDRIRDWWGRNPRLGVGVACGSAGLVVIDVDAHGGAVPPRDRILPGIPIGAHVDLTGLESGFHTLAVLAELQGQPSPVLDEDTLRVVTPSGGLHVWYRTQPGRRMLSSTGSSSTRHSRGRSMYGAWVATSSRRARSPPRAPTRSWAPSARPGCCPPGSPPICSAPATWRRGERSALPRWFLSAQGWLQGAPEGAGDVPGRGRRCEGLERRSGVLCGAGGSGLLREAQSCRLHPRWARCRRAPFGT